MLPFLNGKMNFALPVLKAVRAFVFNVPFGILHKYLEY